MITRYRPGDTFDFAFDEDGTGGFNSFKDLEILMGQVSKPLAPAMTESYQDVPARYGGVYLGTSYGERQFDIPITIMAANRAEYNRKITNLTNALINTEYDANTQYPLRFNDNPDVMYYGHFTEIPTPTFISEGVQDCQTTLTFMLADPRGFGPTQTIKVVNNDQQLLPDGDMLTSPVIHIIPKTPLYYLGYETLDKYVAVGYNVDNGNTITDANGVTTQMNAHQKLQVDDPCTSLATWFESSPDTQQVKPYRGEVDGKLTATESSIMVGKDKNGHYNWGTKGKHKDFYGPVAIHNGLPKVAPYWKTSVRLHHVKQTGKHNSRAMGKVEAYCLDNDGQIRARMGIEDPSTGRMPLAYIQLGTNFKSGSGKYKTIFFNRGNSKQQTNLDTTKVKIAMKKEKKKVTVKTKSGGKTKSKAKKPTSKTKAKTTTKYVTTYKNVYSYNNTDAYSNFWGEFTLEHFRKSDGNGGYKNMFTASIVEWNLKTGLPYDATDTAHTVMSKTVTDDGKYSFAMANLAVFFGKHDISEDLAKPVVAYRTAFETLTSYKQWASDGVDDPDDIPHVIANAGEEVIIDCADKNVTVNGRSLNKYVSWLSTFPGLTGGVPQTLHFAPDPANADIYIEYKPTYK
ncbi:distal tail protein Dit [Secundilactobacillus kimchicus]|uniref:distal tail protein Dit n=1 Tax=Secundilactobacillus kimchicus TaxID=528209 RepID=UPI0020790DF9|nr:distal tail protein Dit [Secundilactobacillus kimchicus]